MLQNQGNDSDSVCEFLDDGGNHQGTEPHGIGADEEKGDLPGEGGPDETVEEAGMSDGRRILCADQIEHKIEGSDNEQAPDTGDVEDDLGKSHAQKSKSLRVEKSKAGTWEEPATMIKEKQGVEVAQDRAKSEVRK